MNWQKMWSLVFLMMLSVSSWGQRGILKQANKYFEAERYQEALRMYNQLKDIDDDEQTLYKRGVANLMNNRAKEAVSDFFSAKLAGYKGDEIYLMTGNGLHHQGKFAEAVNFYKNYLRYIDDKDEQRQILTLIKQCNFGLDHQYDDQLAFVENLGGSVNTEYDEINPVQSPTSQNKYYFSSNRAGSEGGLRNKKGYKDDIYGKYSCDMYAVQLDDGNWTPVSAFHPILNGPKNDLIQAFSSDGSVMYYLQTQDFMNAKLYSDTFQIDRDEALYPTELILPAVTTQGDKDIHVFNGSTILFASQRSGGYGGYDLYVSKKSENGWSEPLNLGPQINSEFDEVSPFLTKSGTKLYFSSNGRNSFGGYDIFSTTFDPATHIWMSPDNVGAPINSAKDDIGFSVSSDGMTGIFTSNRAGSFGGMDLHLAYFKDQITDQLLYVENVPFADKFEVSNEEVVSNEDVAVSPTSVPIKVREFYNEPLYYGDDELIASPINLPKLKRITDMMNVYPEMEVVFTGNSAIEGMREFDLYFTIKRAEKAAQYLMDNGVSPNRIYVKGLGSNYPLAKQDAGRVSQLAKKNNRRIDVEFVNVDPEKFVVINERPNVADQLKDLSSDVYISTTKGLSYKVFVANTKQMYKADVIRRDLTGSVDRNMSRTSYDYSLGVFENYEAARLFKNKLVREGLIEAQVRAYIDGKPMNKAQLLGLEKTYPDLLRFLEY